MPTDPTYQVASGGSLKLKGLENKKKHKKKSKSSSSEAKETALKRDEVSFTLDKGKGKAESSEAHQDVTSSSTMTEAERRFEAARRKRMADKVAKEARLSHKEKVDRFNEHLANLTEHFDLPKVGPG